MSDRAAPARRRYHRRMDAVVDHVARDPVRAHSLDELAAVASLSPFHFHRLFRALCGETVGQMVNRLRLERAAALLIYNARRSVTDVAMELGYSSSANFTRAFSRHFGCPPTQFRLDRARNRHSSKIGKATSAPAPDNAPMDSVSIAEHHARTLASLRHVGAYDHRSIEALFERLSALVGRPDGKDDAREHIGITWSDSNIAAMERWRYDACMSIERNGPVGGEATVRHLNGGTVAELNVELPPAGMSRLGEYWNRLLGLWLPESGCEPDDRPGYEIYRRRPGGGFQVTLCLPVRPLR